MEAQYHRSMTTEKKKVENFVVKCFTQTDMSARKSWPPAPLPIRMKVLDRPTVESYGPWRAEGEHKNGSRSAHNTMCSVQ